MCIHIHLMYTCFSSKKVGYSREYRGITVAPPLDQQLPMLIANRQSCSSDVRACWFPFPSSVLHRGARDLSLSSAVQCLRKHNIMLSPISNLRKNCDYRTPSTRDLLF
jgi:hypothetical protein